MKVLYIVLAVIFYVLGAIGLVLPVIPQIPFLLAGTFFLALSSEKLKKKIMGNKLYHEHVEPYVEKYPKISELLEDEPKNEGEDLPLEEQGPEEEDREKTEESEERENTKEGEEDRSDQGSDPS